MGTESTQVQLRHHDDADRLDLLEPLWNALQRHHADVLPALGGETPPRGLEDAWDCRRAKYEGWLEDPQTFFIVAERDGCPVGYAFVTVGAGFAAWATGRVANLETLSVLADHRGVGVGAQLLEAVWATLVERGIRELAITAAIANVDSHRFYERQGFKQAFVIYYGTHDG